jgi:Fe2+ or Zn2+ uptake regulation protein
MMDRALLLQQLGQSEKRIEAGVQKVTKQRETIAGLAADGHDAVEAKRVLADFEQAQAMSLAHYERIEIELARTKW